MASNHDAWHTRAIPIMEAIRDREAEDFGLMLIGDLADATGLEPMLVAIEVERLIEGGYVSARLAKMPTGGDVHAWYLSNARLAPDGARVVGVWPSSDPYEALVAILERRIDEAEDEPTRSRFRRMRDAVTALGRDVGTNVVANVLFELGRRGF